VTSPGCRSELELLAFANDLDEEEPARELRLGFDRVGRLLEIVVLRFGSGSQLTIHAVKARRKYGSLVDESSRPASV